MSTFFQSSAQLEDMLNLFQPYIQLQAMSTHSPVKSTDTMNANPPLVISTANEHVNLPSASFIVFIKRAALGDSKYVNPTIHLQELLNGCYGLVVSWQSPRMRLSH
ncbi:hypothetical protein ElyMa_001315200 [Elysia marginata]|uniref:Uncharacterized protein n=1 Tax=Elysia marginata TaxID=1093978 RepID=A0AAV4IJF6_9GAST|nr:hypothetical protein ElyMa_001315200 [Elysia marginata]